MRILVAALILLVPVLLSSSGAGKGGPSSRGASKGGTSGAFVATGPGARGCQLDTQHSELPCELY